MIRHRSFAFFLRTAGILLLILFVPAFQSGDIFTQEIVLYDASLGTTPHQQGFSYLAVGATSSQAYQDGVTLLDTTGDINEQAGYFSRETLPLDRHLGYKLQFTIQLIEEEHIGERRSGFSILVVSSDLRGLELAFWENEIWVQDDDAGKGLFKHAEGAVLDTITGLVNYELDVHDDSYALYAGSEQILSGPLRDYTAFDGFPDPYESPGFVFLGDNTRRGAGQTALSYVAVVARSLATATPVATVTTAPSATAAHTPTMTATATTEPTAVPATSTLRATVAPSPQPTVTPTPQPENKLLSFLKSLLAQFTQ